MKVKALIEMLQKADEDAEVMVYDGDSEQMEPVTGMVYGGGRVTVELYTDEP